MRLLQGKVTVASGAVSLFSPVERGEPPRGSSTTCKPSCYKEVNQATQGLAGYWSQILTSFLLFSCAVWGLARRIRTPDSLSLFHFGFTMV